MIVTVQPFASRVTETERCLPFALLLELADDVPPPAEEADTELCEPPVPVLWARALAEAELASTRDTTTRPSAM